MRQILLLFPLLSTVLVNCQTICNKNMSDERLIIKTFPTGLFGSNCYVISQNGIGFIVDAGSNDMSVLQYIEENKIYVQYIFCTHSHIDHVLFAMDLKEYTGAKTALHSADVEHYKYYTSERISEWIKDGTLKEEQLPYIDKFIKIKYETLLSGGEVFTIGKMKIEILYTPGHSMGSICLLVNGKYLFSGDTVYNDYLGNADVGLGNYEDLIKSAKEKILPLNDSVTIYQGHGGLCSMKEIRRIIQLQL